MTSASGFKPKIAATSRFEQQAFWIDTLLRARERIDWNRYEAVPDLSEKWEPKP